MVRSLRCLGMAALMVLALPVGAITSTFDTDSEGWTALGDAIGPLTWAGSGGNPGGHVFINDATVGGVTYFAAPASFLGNASAALGTTLSFDLMQVFPGSANQFNDEDVVLRGAGLTIAFDLAANPGNGSWTSYAVPLTAAGWHLNTLAGAAVTAEQFAAVIGDLTALQIRAEYQTGTDVGRLDNVVLQSTLVGAIPEPSTYALFGVGLAALAWARRRHHRVRPNTAATLSPALSTRP
jgi:Laminin B (Domain IV)/PEP-CTERM motif